MSAERQARAYMPERAEKQVCCLPERLPLPAVGNGHLQMEIDDGRRQDLGI
jgi:hypothetical protein